MGKSAPALLPIFRSQLQAELLAAVLLHPDEQMTLTELAERLGASVSTVQREADRLIRSGILVGRRVGRSRVIAANAAGPLFEPLARLIMLTFGPAVVVAEEFASVSGLDAAYIYGSWAARYRGAEGEPPRDVDVLVLGRPSRGDVYDAAERSEQRLGRQVNPTVRALEEWADPDDAFLKHLRSGPLVQVLPREPVGRPA